jgi:hypothetical protein
MREETSTGKRSKIANRFAQALLAGTCLAGASGVASASVVIEGLDPAPADFPNAFSGYLLPVGTDIVAGTLTSGTDEDDWFQFEGLLPLSPFSITASQPDTWDFSVFNSSGVLLDSGSGDPVTFSGTVPADGVLIANVNYNEGNSYQVSLTADLAAVPEPGTLAMTALALGGALAWRRRRKA